MVGRYLQDLVRTDQPKTCIGGKRFTSTAARRSVVLTGRSSALSVGARARRRGGCVDRRRNPTKGPRPPLKPRPCWPCFVTRLRLVVLVKGASVRVRDVHHADGRSKVGRAPPSQNALASPLLLRPRSPPERCRSVCGASVRKLCNSRARPCMRAPERRATTSRPCFAPRAGQRRPQTRAPAGIRGSPTADRPAPQQRRPLARPGDIDPRSASE